MGGPGPVSVLSNLSFNIGDFYIPPAHSKLTVYNKNQIKISKNLFNFADFILVAVILLSYKFNLNPDNLATPLAASIGDVVSLTMLSFIASLLFHNLGKTVV